MKKVFVILLSSIMLMAGCDDSNTIPNQHGKHGNQGGKQQPVTGEEPNPGTGEQPGTGDKPDPGTGEDPDPGSGDKPDPGTGEDPDPGTGEKPDPDLDPSIPRDVVGGLLSQIEEFTCEAPEELCFKEYYLECKNNHYYIKHDCGDNVCLENIGCGVCTPNYKTCDGNNVVRCANDGLSYSVEEQCKTLCYEGQCLDDLCPEDATFIYLVDSNYHLIKFNPGAKDGNYLTELFTLNCGNGSSTPFSMAVDRDANAWVLYSDSTLYKIKISNPTCEKITKFNTNGSGLSTFGMAFSLDIYGGTTDTLYIARSESTGSFGSIDPTNLSYSPLASFPSYYDQTPELTGTARAELYSFSPGEFEQHISKIDKSTGNVIVDYTIPGAGSFINAWAFAHWGGDYFVFETLSTTGNNRILRFSPETNETITFLEYTPYRVVGAGVSTCAPTVRPDIN